MLRFRKMEPYEAEKIAQIDAENYIENVWRRNEQGEYYLKRINWTEKELPNGYAWHFRRFREALADGGSAFGCFREETLLGYATVWGHVFGQQEYVLLDQLFVSRKLRSQGIGRKLFALCAEQARQLGARKLYLCAGSMERTMAFYKRLGCIPALEPDPRLVAEDLNDIQLEYDLWREL